MVLNVLHCLFTDEEMMATEVAPSSVVELTDLGKCLMKHEVGTSLLQLVLPLLWADALRKCRSTLLQTPGIWPL